MNSYFIKSVVGSLLVSLSFSALAQQIPGNVPGTKLTKKSIEVNRVNVVENDYEYFGLTEQEWTRYQTLVKSGKVWTPNETPTFVLGLHARNEQELKRFAELEADLQVKQQEMTLALGKAYSDIMRVKYPDLAERFSKYSINQIQDPVSSVGSLLKTKVDSIDFNDLLLNGDSFVVFVTNECRSCQRKVGFLIEKGLAKSMPVHLYFKDMSTEEAITFARSIKLPPELTKSKRVTMNTKRSTVDDLWAKLEIKFNKTPDNYYMTRQNEYIPLDF